MEILSYHLTTGQFPSAVFSKIFEKLVYKRFYRFLEMHKVLYSLQFGFQENRSIDYALVRLTETVRDTIDIKKFGCGVYIDLQKAVDTALEWFKSHHFERKQ